MDKCLKYTKHIVALLILGSATLLISCKEEVSVKYNPETLVTQRSDTLTSIVSENGRKQYRFTTPLMEGYDLAREPYTEYRRGVFLETFKDSTQEVESTIMADYAIRYEKRSLWQARGNVVATSSDGRTLYTEQLFWDEKTERIYSNVESTVVQGDDIFVGEGFEADDKFKHWTFRNYTGRLALDISQDDNNEEQEHQPVEETSDTSLEEQTPEPLPGTFKPAAAPTPSTRPSSVQRQRDNQHSNPQEEN